MRLRKSVIGAAVLVAGVVGAQQPLPPLRTEPVLPAVGLAPAKAAPIDRFLSDPRAFPDATIQTVYSARQAADWLARMNQPDGRFYAGFNPALYLRLDDDSDTRQATAAVGLSRAAAFTGDAKLTATAAQAALTLLTLTKTDPADAAVRVPLIAADRGNRVAFAALAVLAVCELPAPDAKLLAKADELCAFLRKHLKPDGMIAAGDDHATAALPGLVCQALMTSDKWTPAEWKREAVANAIAFYRPAFKKAPSAELAGTMLPAVADFCLRVKSEGGCGFAFEMADRLCDAQFTADDARNRNWVGGFKLTTGEPTATSLPCAHAVAAALHLAGQVPDITRIARYRTATLAALKFGRGLQLTAEGTRHFDKGHVAWLIGGATNGPSDGCVRVEPTADLLAAQLRFLASGGEKGGE